MDPMTAALIAKGVISAGKAIQGISQRRQARELEEETMAKGMPRLQTPAEYYQLYKSAQNDKAMQAEIAQAEQMQAANLEALQTGGSRALLGGAPAVAAVTQANVAEAARRGYQREQQALQVLAGAQASTAGANFQADLMERNRQLQNAAAGFQAGTETLYSGLEGVASAAIMGQDEFGGINKQTTTETPQVGSLLSDLQNQSAPPVGGHLGYLESQNVPQPEVRTNDLLNYLGNQPRALQFKSYMDSFDVKGRPNRDSFDTSGNLNKDIIVDPTQQWVFSYEDGGAVTTKGEFNHNTNPLHVIDNDGQKVAEVTGEETLVYNPQQRQLMKKIMNRLINKGKVSLTKAEREEAKDVLKAFQG